MWRNGFALRATLGAINFFNMNRRIKRKKYKMNLTDKDKTAAIEAGKQGVKDAYQKTEGKGLKWWERLLWVIAACIVYAASSLLGGCSTSAGMSLSSAQGMLVVSRDAKTGAVVVSVAKPHEEVPAVEQRFVK